MQGNIVMSVDPALIQKLDALTAAMHQEQSVSAGDIGYLSKGGGAMTIGNEVTTTTVEPSVLATEKAEPLVKAKPYGGSGS